MIPDYYAKHPKNCMGGWGRRFLNMNPKGDVLPCHAAETIPHLKFDNVREKSLKWIWENSEAFNIYRGTDWMPDPCRTCDRKEIDWGGCRCQAMALTGDAKNTDPACSLSPLHQEIFLWLLMKQKDHPLNLFIEDMEFDSIHLPNWCSTLNQSISCRFLRLFSFARP